MLNKSKKAEVGETITWIVAFLVIFFIMLLFSAACMAIAATKGFTSTNQDYTAKTISGDIQTTETLITILNTKTDGKSIQEQLIAWSRELNKDQRAKIENSIKSELKQILDKPDQTNYCYDFTVSVSKPEISLFFVSNIQLNSVPTPGGSTSVQNIASSAPRNFAYLDDGINYITIQFYQGVCN